MRTYILPNGETTEDATLYGKTWCKLADKVCTLAEGAYHVGLNTRTIVIRVDGIDCEMPVALALAIEKLIDNNDDI